MKINIEKFCGFFILDIVQCDFGSLVFLLLIHHIHGENFDLRIEIQLIESICFENKQALAVCKQAVVAVDKTDGDFEEDYKLDYCCKKDLIFLKKNPRKGSIALAAETECAGVNIVDADFVEAEVVWAGFVDSRIFVAMKIW